MEKKSPKKTRLSSQSRRKLWQPWKQCSVVVSPHHRICATSASTAREIYSTVLLHVTHSPSGRLRSSTKLDVPFQRYDYNSILHRYLSVCMQAECSESLAMSVNRLRVQDALPNLNSPVKDLSGYRMTLFPLRFPMFCKIIQVIYWKKKKFNFRADSTNSRITPSCVQRTVTYTLRLSKSNWMSLRSSILVLLI